MRTVRSILPSFLAMLLLAALVDACTSTAGQTCRKPGDCESGLLCCQSGAVVTGGVRGTCQSACTVVVVDAGTDLGMVNDASSDSGSDASSDSGSDAGLDSGLDASDIDASADAGTD